MLFRSGGSRQVLLKFVIRLETYKKKNNKQIFPTLDCFCFSTGEPLDFFEIVRLVASNKDTTSLQRRVPAFRFSSRYYQFWVPYTGFLMPGKLRAPRQQSTLMRSSPNKAMNITFLYLISTKLRKKKLNMERFFVFLHRYLINLLVSF